MRWFCCLIVVPILSSSGWAQEVAEPAKEHDFLETYREKAVEKWEKAISEMEQRNQTETYPADAILFLGSSSIRRWDDIQEDMAPFRPIQRGYGGAKYSDLAIFAERLIRPHQYRALAIFVGNDVSGSTSDKTPDQVEELVRYVLDVSMKHQPSAPVLLIEVTPTQKRFKVWPQIRQVNARLREVALSTANVHFVATAEHYLDPDGNPRNEYFVEDKLHLNEQGYDVWANVIRQQLSQVLRWQTEFANRADVETETAQD